jgi:N,N'-diacetyllegionaminate synthase
MGFDVGKVKVGSGRTVVIAEAGVNHLGRMDYAEELIKTAARAGADIVKFQTYKASKLTTQNAPRFWSWEGEIKSAGSQFDSYARLDSFEREQYIELIKMCDQYGVEFMSTPFDFDAADMLADIGMKGYKIASCDLNNLPFLKHIAAKGLPIMLSTGAADISEIRKAVNVIEAEGNRKLCIMHCTLCYPTDPKDSNLAALKDIEEHFPDYVLGLSDHTLGTIVPAASVLYGSQVIEKHYTFDKTLPESADHWLSLDEKELADMVRQVRTLEQAIGGGRKVRLECEMPAFKFARRSVVAVQSIKMGAVITPDMLAAKRPGTGLPPEFIDRFVGAVAARDIDPDTLLKLEDIRAG